MIYFIIIIFLLLNLCSFRVAHLTDNCHEDLREQAHPWDVILCFLPSTGGLLSKSHHPGRAEVGGC